MGIVAKQGSINFIVVYLGTLLGALNKLYFSANDEVLTQEQFGFLELVMAIALLGSQLSNFSAPNTIIKFLPKYKETKEATFIKYIIKISLLITLVSTLIGVPLVYLLLEGNNSNELYGLIYAVFPLAFLIMLQELLSSYLRGLLKTVFQIFVKDVAIRGLQMLLLIGIWFGLYSFSTFIGLYVGAYILTNIMLLWELNKLGKLLPLVSKSSKNDLEKSNDGLISRKEKLKLIKFRLVTAPGGFSNAIVSRIDQIMINSLVPVAMLTGLQQGAIFAVSAYMARLIVIPAKSIANIANPVIAKAWARNDRHELLTVYRKTALNQLIVGLITFVIIWINLDSLYELLSGKNYSMGKESFLFIAVANLVAIGMGMNGSIVLNSKHYWFVSVGVPILAVITIVTNIIFIPAWGMTGAAFATLISVSLFNVIMFLFALIKFKMQPFSWRNFFVLFVGIGCVYLNEFLPSIGGLCKGLSKTITLIIDIGYRTILIGVIYGVFILLSKVSPDINKMALLVYKKATFRK